METRNDFKNSKTVWDAFKDSLRFFVLPSCIALRPLVLISKNDKSIVVIRNNNKDDSKWN